MANTVIGFHASHEQFRPDRLLRLVQQAEEAGFDAAMCSDHWAPWSEAQGESGFAWSWLGAALQATSLPFGVVNAPGQRYHPAIIAQAVATLNVMYPERLWIAVGSGQLLNEHITGERWPSKDERNSRLRESAEVMTRLWDGETVTHDGSIRVSDAILWTRPDPRPKLVGAAVTPATAAFVAPWADALITVAQPPERMDAIVDAWRANGGTDKPMYLQVHLAWATSDGEARDAALAAWSQGCIPNSVLTDLTHPSQIAAAASTASADHIHDAVRISSDLEQHAAWIAADVERGFEAIYLHEVGPDQEHFIETFGGQVLPRLRGSS
jgi:coenzyme F420-dependent glucose-6-phosphate dehydrogenase